jgi:uncharacterized GH25 family protein
MKSTLFLVAALVAATTAAQAHDIWITIDKAGGNCRAIVNYGHPHDRPAALADKIVDFAIMKGDNRASLMDGLTQTQNGTAITVTSKAFDCGHTLLALHYENGFWVKTPSGAYRNATKRSVPGALDSLWSVKFAKVVTGAGAPWSAVVGHELEIVPLADPAAKKADDSLPVRVLFQGAPLANIAVERTDGMTPIKEEDIPRFTTDKDGVALVQIPNTGPQLLAVDYKVSPSKTPELAGADLYNATFSFVVDKDRY